MSSFIRGAFLDDHALFYRLLDQIRDNPWWGVHLGVTLLLLTRAYTQIWSTKRVANQDFNTKDIIRLPYWIPYLGSTPAFSFHSQSWLLAQSRAHASAPWALKLSGQDYIVITSPALQAQLLGSSPSVSTADHDQLRSSRFFNKSRASTATSRRVSRAIHAYTSDKTRLNKLTHLLEGHAFNLISPSRSWVDQAQWERTAEVEVLSTTPTLTVSASLPTLIRDFSSHIFMSTLLGTSFVEANPGFIDDFFKFSYKYAMFMTGLPYWIAPGLGPPALARERCLLALDGLVNAIVADINNKSMSGMGTGMLYDVDDVHPGLWDLIRQLREEDKDIGTRAIGCELLEVIWDIVFASANSTIWLLLYLFMSGDENRIALATVREELSKVVEVVKPAPTGLPFEDPPRLKFSKTNIEDACPTLKNALLEVHRLEMEAEKYLNVKDDLVLESDLDKFQLEKGDHVYVACGATSKDTQYWDRPRRFVPSRFETNKGQAGQKMSVPSFMLALSSTAQTEIICLVAALLCFYDFSSAVEDGQLKHPGTKMVAGIGTPKKDMQAKITRREVK